MPKNLARRSRESDETPVVGNLLPKYGSYCGVRRLDTMDSSVHCTINSTPYPPPPTPASSTGSRAGERTPQQAMDKSTALLLVWCGRMD